MSKSQKASIGELGTIRSLNIAYTPDNFAGGTVVELSAACSMKDLDDILAEIKDENPITLNLTMNKTSLVTHSFVNGELQLALTCASMDIANAGKSSKATKASISADNSKLEKENEALKNEISKLHADIEEHKKELESSKAASDQLATVTEERDAYKTKLDEVVSKQEADKKAAEEKEKAAEEKKAEEEKAAQESSKKNTGKNS